MKGSEYLFPYPDEIFDMAIASSIITHMLQGDTKNYLRETARVLKKGGGFLASVFLLNSEAEEAIKQGKTIFDFTHRIGPCRTSDPDCSEEGVAYEKGSKGERLIYSAFFSFFFSPYCLT